MIARLFMLIVVVVALRPPVYAADRTDPDAEIAAYRLGIDKASEGREKAKLHRDLGNLYAARENHRAAAQEYKAALLLSRDFPEKDRLRMAIVMSWGGEHDSALTEFTRIVSENPSNLDARLGRARTLGWSGRLDEAVSETDLILQLDPGNRDALLVRANTLKWQGKTDKALEIYRALLAGGDDFDTRLGYTYALMASGDRAGMRESMALLAPRYPYQEKELQALREEIDRITDSEVTFNYSYYNDTDDNTVHRYAISGSTLVGRVNVGAGYLRTEATDLTRDNSSDAFTATLSGKFAGGVRLGAGAGFTLNHGTADTAFFTGGVRALFDVLKGVAGVSGSREVFTDTATIIGNNITLYNTRVFFAQKLTDRLKLDGSYSFRDYSDDNTAHEVQVAPAFTLLRGNPVLNLGYRFRYLNFERQSGGGYFDPRDFISNGVFLAFNYEVGGFYLYLEPYGGYQEFRRNGVDSHDLFGSIVGSTGYRINRNFLVELNGEFGNYAAQTATGFKYHLAGAKLKVFF